MIKLTEEQFKDFKFVTNLRKQMLRKKGKFINPKIWNYGSVVDAQRPDGVRGALIFIPFETIEDFKIEVDDARN